LNIRSPRLRFAGTTGTLPTVTRPFKNAVTATAVTTITVTGVAVSGTRPGDVVSGETPSTKIRVFSAEGRAVAGVGSSGKDY